MNKYRSAIVLAVAFAFVSSVQATEWVSWRGPNNDGAAPDTGLVSSWSPDGENLVWKAPLISRSTPVVVGGRVCVNGRVGEEVERQEFVACYAAEDGKKLWEDRFNVYNTTVPFNRVGWASLAADPETGNVYAHGVAGQLRAYAPDGKLLWDHFLTESIGQLHGYGGRTQTALVHGDTLFLTIVTSGWGANGRPSHRVFAFDKRTGEIDWFATPGGFPKDMNTQAFPAIGTANGRTLLIHGNADGHIYAQDIDTGETVWKFLLSKRGINSSPLVVGETLYVSHSEENIDDPTMGRLVAIDITGKGDVTTTHEKWRINELTAGFPSPAYKDGMLYIVDNSANLLVVDTSAKKIVHEYALGTVGKASPVLADGKIFVPEINGRFHILKLTDEGVQKLDEDELKSEGERYSELYGSAAVAYGRVFLSTEGWLYAIGDKNKKIDAGKSKTAPMKKAKPADGPATMLHVSPTELLLQPGDKVKMRVSAFNAAGDPVKTPKFAFSVEGMKGKFDGDTFIADPSIKEPLAGKIVAKAGEVEGFAVGRIVPPLPWSEDFSAYPVDKVPPTWIGAGGKFKIVEIDGNKMLAKTFRPKGLLRNATYMGPSDITNVTMEADLMGSFKKRRKADLGLIAGGYTLDLLGNSQKLQIRTWPSENRITTDVDFPWEMNQWYRMRLQVSQEGGKAVIRGKVWPKGTDEPKEWSIQTEDPLPIPGGSPGLIGYSPADIYYDNIKVMENGQ